MRLVRLDIAVPDKALSFTQPWVAFVVGGWKPVENRKWPPPVAMLGQYFALHASLKYDPLGEAMAERYRELTGATVPRIGTGVHGAIVGVARLDGVVDKLMPRHYSRNSGWREYGTDEVAALRVTASPWCMPIERARYGWYLNEVYQLEQPIPCKGALSFWRLPEGVRAALADASVVQTFGSEGRVAA